MLGTAYQFAPLLTNATTNGTGQTVVVIVACGDPSISSDLAAFDSQFGLPPANLSVYRPQGTVCTKLPSWSLETALDVEWAHAMAPGAAIALVEMKSQSAGGMLEGWNYSLTHHLGNVITNSWGTRGYCPTKAKTLLNVAGAGNVTILAASGDSGPGRPWLITEPADCRDVLTVGGTTLTVNGSGTYSGESPWTGSGGGYVLTSAEPPYQTKANITDKYTVLAKPDVAAVADPKTGVWVYENGSGGWQVVGGTSLACPLWAGFLTDVNGWRVANGLAPVGQLDRFLYLKVYGPKGGSGNYAHTMHDVVVQLNSTVLGKGWDISTGTGSFQAFPLAALLAVARGA